MSVIGQMSVRLARALRRDRKVFNDCPAELGLFAIPHKLALSSLARPQFFTESIHLGENAFNLLDQTLVSPSGATRR